MTTANIPYTTNGLDHVVIRAKDINVMLAFYRDVLGLTVAKHNEPLGLWHLAAGTAMIDLVDMNGTIGKAGGPPPGEAKNIDHFALKIAPFDAAALQAYFEQHGVSIEPAKTRFGADGDGPSVYLHDPENNVVELKGAS